MAELDEEQAWIRKSRQGDHAAFEALITRYQRMIHSLTFRMTGSQADAEDLAQETFIQAFRQLGSYRAEAKFTSWLYRIAVNLSLNWKKRRERETRLLAEWGEQQAGDAGPDSQRSRQVQEALLKLNPKQRATVVLTTYDGLNHAEAAEVLGCSETTVSWRLFSARGKLKKLLTRAQEQEDPRE
jgi:RNA polymerase sigma-70 factor (ECF subfamily)